MENNNFVKSPLKKVRVADLTNGKFVAGSTEEMRSNSLITVFGDKVSRAGILGTAVERYDGNDGNFSSLTIDDGSDAIHVKAFNESVGMLKQISMGDTVFIGGKIKNYADENFMVPEMIRKVEDSNAETLWRLERLNEIAEKRKMIDEIKSMHSQVGFEETMDYAREKFGIDEEVMKFILEESKEEVDYKPKILDLIQQNDAGEGVEIAKLLELSKLDENVFERALNGLIDEGMVYEPKVGRLRKI